MSEQKLTPKEEEWGALRSYYHPPLQRLLIGLTQAMREHDTGKLDRECAATAIAATIAYLRAIEVSDGMIASLDKALEIIEAGIDPASLPHCRRIQAIVSNLNPHIDRLLPPLNGVAKRKMLSSSVQIKVLGSIAIECEMKLNGGSLVRALKTVVGVDAGARNSLKNFRYNMKEKDTPKGAREEFFSSMQTLDLIAPEQAALLSLMLYKKSLGQKAEALKAFKRYGKTLKS